MSISKEEQIRKIKKIMDSPEVKIPNYIFNFGKHKGLTLCHVYKYERNYLIWLYNNVDELPKVLEKFIQETVMV